MAIKEKVLVIEDQEIFQDLFTNQIGGVVELLQAQTQKEAVQLLREHPDIVLIVLDGLVPKRSSQEKHAKTTGLAQTVRIRGFSGKILAYSSDKDINAELMENGCVGAIDQKGDGPAVVLRELGMA